MAKILLIEDNPADVYLIREALRRVDPTIEIERLEDGDEALERLKSPEIPDLIVLDLNLPKADGASIVRCIRADSRLARTIIVTWTSSALPSDGAAAAQLGADKHIIKPLQWEEYEQIGTLLRELIAHGRKTGEGAVS